MNDNAKALYYTYILLLNLLKESSILFTTTNFIFVVHAVVHNKQFHPAIRIVYWERATTTVNTGDTGESSGTVAENGDALPILCRRTISVRASRSRPQGWDRLPR